MSGNEDSHVDGDSSLVAGVGAGEIDECTCASLSSSSSSSPLPVDSLGPIFQVRFVQSQTDSSILTFQVCRLDDPEQREKWWQILRSHEDFVNFNQQLLSLPKYEGVIFPPLPVFTGGKFDEANEDSLGMWHKQMERYIQLVCTHPTLGRNQILSDFLSTAFTSQSDKVARKGIFAKFAESFETRKTSHKDIEDFFQNERDWVANYSVNLKAVANNISTVVNCKKKISGQLKHLTTALSMNAPVQSEIGIASHHLCSDIAESFLSMKDVIDDGTRNGQCNWFVIWDLYSQYVQNEQLMLNRRTALLINYENSNRNLDKAKPHKKDEAEVLKKAAEQTFEDCSDVARHEIKAFHKQRVAEMKSSLTQLARSELESARRMKETLTEALERMRRFETPLK